MVRNQNSSSWHRGFDDARRIPGGDGMFDSIFDDRSLFDVSRAAKNTDVPAKASTKASVKVGEAYQGVVDFAGDVDWIKVSLVAGRTYVIDELGSENAGPGTLFDPRLVGIYNAKSKPVAGGNDDWMGSLNAHIEFTPTISGTYYIAASGYAPYVGTYQVRLVEKDAVAPILISSSPADEALNVAANSNLTFQFSEAIQLGQGAITINNGAIVYTVQSSEILLSGNTLTINPNIDLLSSTEYSLNFAYDAVKDFSGNSFAGHSSYNFQTAASSAPTSGTWNIMIYIAADNDLESYALYNLNQIESVALPANVKVTALVDRISGHASGSGDWIDTRFGFVQKDNSTSVTSFPTPGIEKNMGDPNTLKEFISNASSLYPADHNMLIIWNHGGGLDGAAWDDSNGGDNLTIKEMSAAIAAANIHFDIIGFDACLMGMTEIVYSLSSYADYIVASQDLEPGDGWSYDGWLKLFETNASPSVEVVADTIVSTYAIQFPSSWTGITLSSVDTSYMPQLTNALKEFSDFVVTANATDLGVISSSARSAQSYPVDPGYNYNYGDLGNFMAKVHGNVNASSALKADALSVLNILQDMVTSEAGTVSAATGLSIYLPAGNDYVDPSYNNLNYEFLIGVPNWDNMLAII